MKRVVVTGLGLISALGIGLEESWKKLIDGETGIDLITSYDTTDQPVKIAGEVKGFEPTDYGIEKKEVGNSNFFFLISVIRDGELLFYDFLR